MFKLRLKKARKKKILSQRELADLLGVSQSTVGNWESGIREPNTDTIKQLSKLLDISVDYLLGLKDESENSNENLFDLEKWKVNNAIPISNFIKVPILGTVRAGEGGSVLQEILGYEMTTSDSITPGETYFWLMVKGDSMFPKFDEGDMVLVKQQTSIDSGSLGVIIVDGEEGLIKKVVYGYDWIELQSFNQRYVPRRFDGEEVLRIKVIGQALEVRRKL